MSRGRNGVKRHKGYQVAVPKLATMGIEGHWGEGKGHSRRGQIVSSHGGKISAEIPLNAYLLYFKGAPKDILKLKGYRS